MLPPPEGLALDPLAPPDDLAGADRAPPPEIRTLPPLLPGLLTPPNDDVRGTLPELLICACGATWPPPLLVLGVEPRGVI